MLIWINMIDWGTIFIAFCYLACCILYSMHHLPVCSSLYTRYNLNSRNCNLQNPIKMLILKCGCSPVKKYSQAAWSLKKQQPKNTTAFPVIPTRITFHWAFPHACPVVVNAIFWDCYFLDCALVDQTIQ